MHGGILLLHAALNSLPISLLSFFGQLAAAWNLVGMKNSSYSFSLFSWANHIFFSLLFFFFFNFYWTFAFLGVVVLTILIPLVATERASAKFVFTHFNTDNGDGINSKAYIFVLGLLMSQYTLTGYDASAHMVSWIVLHITQSPNSYEFSPGNLRYCFTSHKYVSLFISSKVKPRTSSLLKSSSSFFKSITSSHIYLLA